ncbi:MAG: DUF5752 family protein [Candidatus Omnitrophica bacterium]|nr:DUF5752 family protein [Candidatus Omnitrophota bacterium]
MSELGLTRASEPFRFSTRVHLRELTGLRARNLFEFVEHLKKVPGSVIYHHTHHYLQQHQYQMPEAPNDFAYWITEILQERSLGEKIASINLCDFTSIRALREEIVTVLSNYLEKNRKKLREVNEGEEFHFVKSISFVLPTPYVVYDLREFTAVLKKITIHSIYFHTFEARLRLEKGINDFSHWVEMSLGERQLAEKIAKLDPYTNTMEGLRTKMIQLIDLRIKEIECTG